MNRALILTAIFFLSVVMVSCGVDDDDLNNTEPCTDNDKFCHSYDGLDWSDASSEKMNWDDAIKYCENLGGRLPTISELRTLIQNCPGTETGGECGVTDECLSYEDCRTDPCGGCEEDSSGKYSVFGDSDWFWSSSEQSGDAGRAWLVYFYNGSVLYYYTKYYFYYHVRCVH